VELGAGHFAGVGHYGAVGQGVCFSGGEGVVAELSGGPPTWGQRPAVS